MNRDFQKFDIRSQPSAFSESLDEAVVTWTIKNGEPQVISRYPDDVWEGAAVGALAALPLAARQIKFDRLPDGFKDTGKFLLYASLRHSLRRSNTPSFSTLIKRFNGVVSFTNYFSQRKVSFEHLTFEATRDFFIERAKIASHVETIVSLVATFRSAAIHLSQGLLNVDFKYPFPLGKGAKHIALALWRDTHGSDFQDLGTQPFSDEDLTLIVRNAHFYLKELSPIIVTALTECLNISDNFPKRRTDRGEEARCYRAQINYLSKLTWPFSDAQINNWPPKGLGDLLSHVRICSAASAITISFQTGARRSEISSLEDGCCSVDNNGMHFLKILYFKGTDELNGRKALIPVDEMVVTAVKVQEDIKIQIYRHMHGVQRDIRYTKALFVQIGYRSDSSPESDRPYSLEDGRLTSTAFTSMFLAFKDKLVPSVEGTISFTRFRRSVARLVTLSMEGAPLVLQTIFGHASYRTTLGYMHASPMIEEEIAEAYPELMVRHLSILYQDRDEIMGGGADQLRSAIGTIRLKADVVTEPEAEMTEKEFVELGLEMMQNGQMILSLIGQGMYCLKPLLSRGPCNVDPAVLLPNVGRCTPLCSHHLIHSDQRSKLIRDIHWLSKQIDDPETSLPMRQFYVKYHGELNAIVQAT